MREMPLSSFLAFVLYALLTRELCEQTAVVGRLFPFQRGLFEDKVASLRTSYLITHQWLLVQRSFGDMSVARYLTTSTLNPTNASFVTQANFWCMIDVVVKLRRLLPIPTLALISLGVTLLVRA